MSQINKTLTELIKEIALKTVASTKPTNLLYGTVISINPLKIQVSKNLILTQEFLVIPKTLTDFNLSVDIDWASETSNLHSHDIKGIKNITIHNSLIAGEKVILAQMQGGQEFIILDRV